MNKRNLGVAAVAVAMLTGLASIASIFASVWVGNEDLSNRLAVTGIIGLLLSVFLFAAGASGLEDL